MSKREKCDDTVTESEGEEPMPKRAATSHSNVAGSQLNGNQVCFPSEKNKSYVKIKSDDDVSPTKVSSSDEESDRADGAAVGPTSSASSVELLPSKSGVMSSQVTRFLENKDSGVSSCQESSQEFADGRIGRTCSSGSTQSFDSQYTESNTQPLSDEVDEEEHQILKRADEFRVTSGAKEFDATETTLGICNFCMTNKKDGVFVHSNSLHLCCCYKCALKVWKKRKCCPICNQKIKNVSKLFVH